jgi:hypothetical protein
MTDSQYPDPTFSDEEIRRITRYRRPAEQLEELHRQGFHRARRGADGKVILERAHYEAVCAGHAQAKRPALRPMPKALA